jgi:uncharacterized membrane protein YphA (DoxX/SURF4 family)
MAQTYSSATSHVPAPSVSIASVPHVAVTRPLFLVARAIFGGYFLYSGLQHFLNTPQAAAYAAAKGVPFPESAVLATGGMLVAGSVCILLGVLPRVGAALIALFLIGVTPIMHAFWLETGDMAMADRAHFTKNLGLLGAALALTAIPGPWPARVFHHHRHPAIGEGQRQ